MSACVTCDQPIQTTPDPEGNPQCYVCWKADTDRLYPPSAAEVAMKRLYAFWTALWKRA